MIRTKFGYKMWSHELVDFGKKGTFVRGNVRPGEIAPYGSPSAGWGKGPLYVYFFKFSGSQDGQMLL